MQIFRGSNVLYICLCYIDVVYMDCFIFNVSFIINFNWEFIVLLVNYCNFKLYFV